MRLSKLILFILLCSAWAVPALAEDQGLVAGPLYSDFPLTLSSGYRQEIVSPFYYSQQTEFQRQWALPPFFCYTRTPDVDWTEMEFLYPLVSYRRFGPESRLQFIQLFSFSNGQTTEENGVRKFTLFPLYFQQRSPDPALNYTALVPFYGHLENRLFRDDIKFLMFPLYSETRKKDVVTDNYLYPLFDVRRGIGLKGWQFWPFVGVENKIPTTATNSIDGQVETVGGYNKLFIAWPFYFDGQSGLGTTNPQTSITILPFYSHIQSPMREQTSYGWPFGYNSIRDDQKKYVEHDLFWPAVVKARGTKTETRIFPFYSRARKSLVGGDIDVANLIKDLFTESASTNKNAPAVEGKLESDFYFWPIYKFNQLQSPPLDRRRTRILFFLYSDITETDAASIASFRRVDFWPFYSFRREFNGDQRLQVLAFLEPLFPNNRSITREYSHLWSFWRAEKNPRTGAASQSLLWNLYRRDQTPQSKKLSLFFGLFQYQSTAEGRQWRLFYSKSVKKPAGRNTPKS